MRPERVTTESPINSGDSADQRTEGSHQRMVRPQPGEVWIHDKYGEVIILRAWGNTACKVSVRATKSPAILFDANLHKKAEV